MLNVQQGQIPNDTGSDGATIMTIEDCKELGGKALKVVFAKNDSFGDRQARVKNWKQFISLQFNAFNPSQQKVPLSLTVKHRRTTSFQTRVDFPFTLNPGKNEVHIGIDELTNVNGSTPDLSVVGKWYLACSNDMAPTLFFGDIRLVGDDLPPAPAPGRAPVAGPPPAYHIHGTIGSTPVHLEVTPDGAAAAAPAAKATIAGDPARLERIRAATMPPITRPVLFCTPEADAICSALEVFPPDNPWNQVVSNWPLHPNSKNIIASIGAGKPLRCNSDMGFILVPPGEPRVEVRVVGYPGESDKGPFPVPANTPIEGWPANYQRNASGRSPTLDDVQRDVRREGGDRHASVVDPVHRMLYEFYQMKKTDRGWQAAQCSSLRSEVQRPAARRLDLDRRGRAADLPRHGPLRRDLPRHGRTRHAVDGGQEPAGLRGSCYALCQPARRREPAADGRADPPEAGRRHFRLLARGPGDTQGPEEVRRAGGR